MTDDFFAVAARQRAHRQFTDEPVADATVEQLVGAAVRAPSAENRQPWEFVVVRNHAARIAIAELMQRAWEGGGRAWSESRLAEHVLDDVDAGMRGGFAQAPVMIVVCVDLDRTLESTAPSSIYPAVQNLLLGATALGLASALTTIALGFARELAELLALPDHVRPMAVVPLGHPPRALGPSRRDAAADHMHRDRYGARW